VLGVGSFTSGCFAISTVLNFMKGYSWNLDRPVAVKKELTSVMVYSTGMPRRANAGTTYIVAPPVPAPTSRTRRGPVPLGHVLPIFSMNTSSCCRIALLKFDVAYRFVRSARPSAEPNRNGSASAFPAKHLPNALPVILISWSSASCAGLSRRRFSSIVSVSLLGQATDVRVISSPLISAKPAFFSNALYM
jgi:hypothetical protein